MTTVAIVGRPNVGKSTLFNRLVGQRLALVHDLPGVTRDRREGEGRLGPLSFRVIDTAGLEEAGDDSLEARMRAQTERAVAEADVALFLIDARAGVTPLDSHFADWLRGQNTPVLLLANKSEGRAGEAGFYESYALGLGEPVAVSAEHGEGLGDLYDALAALLPEAVVGAESAPAAPEDDSPDLQLAIVGRPNVGKSTLINRLIGADRLLTGPEAGITRDAIAVPWAWGDRRLRLVDTAGLRRKARITDRLEKMSGSDSLRAVRFAQVVALVLDAGLGFEKQDLTIARHVVEEGRALVVVVNKWDAVEDRRAVLQGLRDRLETSLTQARGVPFITLSALTGKGLERLMPTVFTAYDRWNQRVSTGRLNRWLDGILAAHPPPMVRGRRLKIRYVTQVKSRPPTFALWVNMPDDLPESYQRHLVNGLRESFDLAGVPIRLLLRRGENPYADHGR